MRPNAGDLPERTGLLTVCRRARAVRGVGREASRDCGLRTDASEVRVAFRGPTAEGGCLGPLGPLLCSQALGLYSLDGMQRFDAPK